MPGSRRFPRSRSDGIPRGVLLPGMRVAVFAFCRFSMPSSFTSSARRWLRHWRVRLSLTVGACLVVGGVGYVRFLRPVPARAHRVDRGDVVREVFARGTVEGELEAELGFDMVGRLSDVLVDEGARVSLGQELARLS